MWFWKAWRSSIYHCSFNTAKLSSATKLACFQFELLPGSLVLDVTLEVGLVRYTLKGMMTTPLTVTMDQMASTSLSFLLILLLTVCCVFLTWKFTSDKVSGSSQIYCWDLQLHWRPVKVQELGVTGRSKRQQQQQIFNCSGIAFAKSRRGRCRK